MGTAGVSARPRSTADVADQVRSAAARGIPLRIAGRGHWLDAARPVAARELLPLDELTGIVDYVPGDLTLTARAGTTLDEIARVTAGERQWLALDPFGSPAGTLGATIATASAGPLAHAFGSPRDNVLGLEAVTGDGSIVRVGGRVVKNVAGFDLTRLFTGSWGSLGVITEITVRLRPLPEVEETWGLAVKGAEGDLASLVEHLRTAPLAPLALELLSPALAARLGAGGGTTLLVRLGGNAAGVRAQREQLRALGAAERLPDDVWGTLRTCEPPGSAVARLSALPSRLPHTWAIASRAASSLPETLLHASVARGVVRCILPAAASGGLLDWWAAVRPFGGTIVLERWPAHLWPPDAPNPMHHRLARGVKRAFDPFGILNPGILGAEQ